MDTRFPITLGGEYTPGTVDIGSKFSRTDTELSQTADPVTTATSVTRSASASASNFASSVNSVHLSASKAHFLQSLPQVSHL